VVDYRSRRPFDLVVCHDVLQYLSHRDAARALGNLATLARRALLLAVLTREDWDDERFDPERTDPSVVLRTTRWYRQRLRAEFVDAGGGLFLKRDEAPVLWSLECLDG
jgi:chemotaxis methyl-accepting protein methylase